MAEAIWAVLQEGLSLSQVPTFTFTDIILTFAGGNCHLHGEQLDF